MNLPSMPPPGSKPPSASATRSAPGAATGVADDGRRGFFAKAAAIVAGGILVVFPFLAGAAALVDPLRRKSGHGQFVPIVPLDALPADGSPRSFPVIDERQDAWTRFPREPVGAVYLRRTEAEPGVEAFNVLCPHAGCFVGFNPSEHIFQCPCHTSGFALDGEVLSGPSPRGLDTLECEVRDDGGQQVVFVKFQNFYTARADKKAKA